MKVKIMGFELLPAHGVGLPDLFKYVEANNGAIFGDRIIAVSGVAGDP
jgi:hypothetical protein